LVDVFERLGIDQVDVAPGVELRRQGERLAPGADGRKRRVGAARAVIRVVAVDVEHRRDYPSNWLSRRLERWIVSSSNKS